MGFKKKTWKNRIAEYINRRLITMEDGSTSLVTVARDEGTISQDGDAFNAANMNNLEDRIEAGFNEINRSLAEKSLKGVFNTSINSDSYGNILLTSVDTVIVSVVSTLTNVILSQPFVSNGKWYTQARDINGNIIKNKSCIVTYYYI